MDLFVPALPALVLGARCTTHRRGAADPARVPDRPGWRPTDPGRARRPVRGRRGPPVHRDRSLRRIVRARCATSPIDRDADRGPPGAGSLSVAVCHREQARGGQRDEYGAAAAVPRSMVGVTADRRVRCDRRTTARRTARPSADRPAQLPARGPRGHLVSRHSRWSTTSRHSPRPCRSPVRPEPVGSRPVGRDPRLAAHPTAAPRLPCSTKASATRVCSALSRPPSVFAPQALSGRRATSYALALRPVLGEIPGLGSSQDAPATGGATSAPSQRDHLDRGAARAGSAGAAGIDPTPRLTE